MTEEELQDTLVDSTGVVHQLATFVVSSKVDYREPRDWDVLLQHCIDLMGAVIKARADAEVLNRFRKV